MSPTLKRAWLATAVWFGLNSFGVASFIVRFPEVKQTLAITNSSLGFALFSGALGTLVTIRLAGKLCARFGSSPLMVAGAWAMALMFPVVTVLASYYTFIASLCLLFIGITLMDVSMNTHAVIIEHQSGKLIMGRLHGIWSIGGILGGFTGGLCSSLHVTLQQQGFLACFLTLIAVLIFRRFLLPASADMHEVDESVTTKTKNPRIFYILGIVGLCAAIIEGSAGDWGAVLITDDFGARGLVASLPYIVFQTAMVIGRFSSDSLTTKYGRASILLVCGLTAFLGLSVGLLIGGQAAIVMAWFAIGAGASVVIPMVFSLAGSIAKTSYVGVIAPSQAVATVTAISYSAFLIGPPVIGMVADFISLRWAMLIPAFLALGIVFGARVAAQAKAEV